MIERFVPEVVKAIRTQTGETHDDVIRLITVTIPEGVATDLAASFFLRSKTMKKHDLLSVNF